MDVVIVIVAMVLLLLLQGFFSGSEIALVHADKLKLHHRMNQGNRGARLVLEMFRKPEVLLGTTLVGTNVSVVALTTLGTLLMIRAFGEIGELYAVLLYTPLFLIFGEVVPKSVYQQKADRIAPVVIFPLRVCSGLFYPVVFVFSRIARLAARLAGVRAQQQNVFVSREKVRAVLEMTEQAANVDVFDRDRIMRVIRFADLTAGQVMIPVSEMTTLSSDQTTGDAIRIARARGHFRLPVYRGERNQIVGVVALSVWDLMDPALAQRPLQDLIGPPHYVTAHQPLDELLPLLQQNEDHMAIVVDEFGSAIGMLTMEDILEEVVGEVVDAGFHFEAYVPRQRFHMQRLDDGSYSLDGRVPITEASEMLGVALPAADAHTVAGMVIARLRHIPKVGESLVAAGYRFTVEEATERMVVRLHVQRVV